MTSMLLFELGTVYNRPPLATWICLRLRCGQYVRKISECSVFYKNVIKLINWGIWGIRDWSLKYHFWKKCNESNKYLPSIFNIYDNRYFQRRRRIGSQFRKLTRRGQRCVCVWGKPVFHARLSIDKVTPLSLFGVSRKVPSSMFD
jgi:hypothetical protein